MLCKPDAKLQRLLGSLSVKVKDKTPYDVTVELSGDPSDIKWFSDGVVGDANPRWDALIDCLESVV